MSLHHFITVELVEYPQSLDFAMQMPRQWLCKAFDQVSKLLPLEVFQLTTPHMLTIRYEPCHERLMLLDVTVHEIGSSWQAIYAWEELLPLGIVMLARPFTPALAMWEEVTGAAVIIVCDVNSLEANGVCYSHSERMTALIHSLHRTHLVVDNCILISFKHSSCYSSPCCCSAISPGISSLKCY
jgi:hypothetical protein